MDSKPGSVVTLTPEVFMVVKYPPENLPIIPQNVSKQYSFFSVSVTPEECSIIAPESLWEYLFSSKDKQPDSVKVDKNWRCFKVEGPLDFGLVGILYRILESLKSVNISVIAVGTYNTDYFLVKAEKTEEAISALKKASFQVNE